MKALFSPAWIGSVVTALVLTATAAAAQDNDIATARELYASADRPSASRQKARYCSIARDWLAGCSADRRRFSIVRASS